MLVCLFFGISDFVASLHWSSFQHLESLLYVFRWRICILKQKISADVAEINLPDTKGHLICVSSSERFVKGSEEGARTGEQNRFFRDEVEHVQQLFKGVGLLHQH